MSRDKIFKEIDFERAKQDHQWGGIEHDKTHCKEDWISFIDKQIQLIQDSENTKEQRERFKKIAAIAIAAIEVYDNRNTKCDI